VRGQRSHALPDLPTVAEFVPGYESSGYFGFGAPANTPAQIVDKLNKEINAGLADPKLKAQLADLGGMVLAGSSTDFGKLITEETEKWGKVIRVAKNKRNSAGPPRRHSIARVSPTARFRTIQVCPKDLQAPAVG
jgi:tripartite-type tricarboxylate transporter receptor subunit TctC